MLNTLISFYLKKTYQKTFIIILIILNILLYTLIKSLFINFIIYKHIILILHSVNNTNKYTQLYVK